MGEGVAHRTGPPETPYSGGGFAPSPRQGPPDRLHGGMDGMDGMHFTLTALARRPSQAVARLGPCAAAVPLLDISTHTSPIRAAVTLVPLVPAKPPNTARCVAASLQPSLSRPQRYRSVYRLVPAPLHAYC